MNKSVENLVELGRHLKTSEGLQSKINSAGHKNLWFVPQFVQSSVDAIIDEMLNEKKLHQWLSSYNVKPINKTVGLIFAGNIPLVGFHDFLCCYVAGCKMKIKLSSKDDELFPFILKILVGFDSTLSAKVEIVEKLKDFDAVIATGSNNTNRYFEYYFKDYPRILRKNRNSIAILNGNETKEDLENLADDIFLYFGFGCRNVSKIYVPVGYDITQLFPFFGKYEWLFQHSKYMNNYDYNRTILALNKTSHFINEFVMLEENKAISSPISVIHYEHWQDEDSLSVQLEQENRKIQCVVSKEPERWSLAFVGSAKPKTLRGQPFPSSVKFGEAQHPQLCDYADGVDTMKFLLEL